MVYAARIGKKFHEKETLYHRRTYRFNLFLSSATVKCRNVTRPTEINLTSKLLSRISVKIVNL